MDTEVTLARLASYFAEAAIPHMVDENEKLVAGAVFLREGTVQLVVRIDEEMCLLRITSPFVVAVPPERRAILSQAVAHINARLALGGFYLDHMDGELGYRAGVPYAGVGICEQQVLQCLATAASTVSAHLSTFQQMIWTGSSIEEMFDIAPLSAQVRQMMEEFLATGEGPVA